LDGWEILFAYFQLNQAVVELARTKLRPEFFASSRKVFVFWLIVGDQHRSRNFARVEIEKGIAGSRLRRWQQDIEGAFLDVQFGFVSNLFDFFLARHLDGDLRQVANHALDVATYVANFSELRCLDFQ